MNPIRLERGAKRLHYDGMIKLSMPKTDHPSRFLILPLWVITMLALGLLMREAATIFLWIVCAFFLFVLLDPVSEFLKAKRWPTAWTAIFLVVTATAIVVALLVLFADLVSGMIGELDQSRKIFMHAYESLNSSMRAWTANLPGLLPAANVNPDISKVEVVQSSPFGGEFGTTLVHGLGSAVTVLTFALLVPILSFFFLAERDSFAKVIFHAFRNPAQPAMMWKGIVASTRAFFLGNLVLGAVTYPIFLILFWLFAVPSTLTLAALATAFNLIPFLGAVLSGFLPGVALYTVTEHAGGPLALYAFCVLIHFAVANFVTPKVLGSRVDINATTSTIALVAWGELWGGVGLILAIPLTSFIKILFENSSYRWLQWIAALMSENVDRALGDAAKPTSSEVEA